MRPNILVLMPDQLRPDWVGPQNRGGAVTPHIDSLAGRGLLYENAVCPSPICGPSRACLATGQEYDRCTVANNRFSVAIDAPNMYRQLAGAGYQVLTCGKLDLLKGELDWGADGQHGSGAQSRLRKLGFNGGLDSGGKHAVIGASKAGADEPYLAFLREQGLAQTHLDDFALRRNPQLGKDADPFAQAGENYNNTDPTPLPDAAYQDDWIGDCGLRILREAASDSRPWFLQVNFAGPHEPMNITQSMAERIAGRSVPSPREGEAEYAHAQIRRAYTAMVERLDEIVGRLLAQLKTSGQLDNTIIILTSDHGEMLGDCGRWEKFIPHQMSIGIPLIVAGPKVAHGTIDGPATFLDLHATILDLAGAEPIAGTDSRSMVAQWQDPSQAHRAVVFSGLGAWRIAFDGRFKLVAGWDPAQDRRSMENAAFDPKTAPWRLVEPSSDPCESRDLATDHPEIAAALLDALRANSLSQRDIR